MRTTSPSGGSVRLAARLALLMLPLGCAGLAGATTAAIGATSPGSSPSAAPVVTTPEPTDPDLLAEDVIPTSPTPELAYAAHLVVPTAVRAAPRLSAKRLSTLQPFGSWNGGPVVLAIREVREVDGERWLRVLLPGRPNSSTGWIAEANTQVSARRYRVLIERSRHRITLFRDGKPRTMAKIVIGASATPTPAGHFAVLEVVRQPKGSELGPWALHLTAHSNVLDNFGGGPGRVAMHGRSGPLLSDPLGSSRSHGCIRMSNAVINKLRAVAVEGTPVEIR